MKTPIHHRPLSARFAAYLAGLTASLLVLAGGIEAHYSFLEAREQISALQLARAQSASREIDRELAELRTSLVNAAMMPWGAGRGFSVAEQRLEFQRLMATHPAITEVQWLDGEHREQLFVSQTEPDRVGAGINVVLEPPLTGAGTTRFGRPFFGADGEPQVRLLQQGSGPGGSAVLARVHLRFLVDVVARSSVDAQAAVYVADREGHLVAHTRQTDALRALDLSVTPLWTAARNALAAPGGVLHAVNATDADGREVIATAMPVPALDGILFVAQDRSVALQPAQATMLRTLAFAAVASAIGLLVSILFARRMAAPIVEMSRAATRIASGEFDARISAGGGTELDQLARDFNAMAGQLQSLYAGLEQQVATRTTQLEEARAVLQRQALDLESLNERLVAQLDELGRRKEIAEQANAAKTRFLASASHDLRQPMHTIGLLVSVLQQRLQEGDERTLADKVQEAVQAMEMLFSSLLDISKLDAGAVRPRVEALPIGPLLGRVRDRFEPQARIANLVLRLRRSDQWVLSDCVLLERILGNLVSNAIAYTRSGGVLIGARRRGAKLALVVADTGIGVPAESRDAIFEEFFRLDDGKPRRAQGLGLGLSIVRRSAELLGHAIRLRSVVGRGSVFMVDVPLAESPACDGALPLLKQEGLTTLAGAFVLVIDDEPDNREALRSLCMQWGCHVVAASSGEAARQELARHLRQPDLIITDYRLGQGEDGIAQLMSLRVAAEEAIPALILTADVSEDIRRRATLLGVALLHKPVSGPRLLGAAREALQTVT